MCVAEVHLFGFGAESDDVAGRVLGPGLLVADGIPFAPGTVIDVNAHVR